MVALLPPPTGTDCRKSRPRFPASATAGVTSPVFGPRPAGTHRKNRRGWLTRSRHILPASSQPSGGICELLPQMGARQTTRRSRTNRATAVLPATRSHRPLPRASSDEAGQPNKGATASVAVAAPECSSTVNGCKHCSRSAMTCAAIQMARHSGRANFHERLRPGRQSSSSRRGFDESVRGAVTSFCDIPETLFARRVTLFAPGVTLFARHVTLRVTPHPRSWSA
jgi:hypothetical protein